MPTESLGYTEEPTPIQLTRASTKATRNCTVDDCLRPFYAHDICHMHYQRMKATGTTNATVTPAAVRLASRLVENASGCLEWTGYIARHGYGSIYAGGKTMLTHRLAWTVANGPIADGMIVCHRCDNPPCCNPDHLFLGTAADNSADMISKGRAHHPEKTHCSKGHAYDVVNTYVSPRGDRQCHTCRNEYRKAHAASAKVKGVAA